ncbi:10376_t:CDS:2, partial [Funneliformis caledonium]
MPPAIGTSFKPHQPYTHRLRKILDEYPDGSQVLREILQNSDDAKSTEQIFILDHNTYSSNSLFKPDLKKYQVFVELADSEKSNQFDKIGVMGVGFNSIYHITDTPTFITGNNYVILDPHEWYYDGGEKFNFVENNLVQEYPDQFAPFRIQCNEPFNDTLFRYPLRTNNDSKISDEIYEPSKILEMFHRFYENNSINSLLFLKFIESITFYELKKGATEPELLYAIQLENADEIREQRCLITKEIVPMMNSLQLGELGVNNQLHTSYIASFCRKKGDFKENNAWLIFNYLDDLLEAEAHFQENFKRNIGDYKFIPNVGLAVPLNDLPATGTLFCFLPLPICMPFPVSVHGYFAVSTNRRSLWSAADDGDLATNALARLKVSWNQYLFEKVLPKAWVIFLRELPLKVSDIRSDNLYKFWPIVKGGTSGDISIFCKDLLQNVVENLNVEDRVFKGPPSSYDIGTVSEVSENLYDTYLLKVSEFHWLSISNGYLEDEKVYSDLPKIIGTIGFPVISTFLDIIKALKDSRHKDFLINFSPAIIRTYLNDNCDRWQDIPKKKVLLLLEYVLKDKKFDELEGFKMIPLADGTFDTLTKHSNSYVYIGPKDIEIHRNNEFNIFENQKYKFIDKTIDIRLYESLYDYVSTTEWNLNIKILNESAI